MEKLKMKALGLSQPTSLSRQQMKNILGGGFPPITRPCFKCCPTDKCSPVRHYCSDKICPE